MSGFDNASFAHFPTCIYLEKHSGLSKNVARSRMGEAKERKHHMFEESIPMKYKSVMSYCHQPILGIDYLPNTSSINGMYVGGGVG